MAEEAQEAREPVVQQVWLMAIILVGLGLAAIMGLYAFYQDWLNVIFYRYQ